MDLLEQAAHLIETAQACAAAGGGGEGWTVFTGPEGGWQIIAGTEHAPAALAWWRGAQAVWQVRRCGPMVRVEGWAEGRRCLVEAPAAGQSLHALVADQRLYASAA